MLYYDRSQEPLRLSPVEGADTFLIYQADGISAGSDISPFPDRAAETQPETEQSAESDAAAEPTA